LRGASARELIDRAVVIDRTGGTPFPQVMAMPLSMVEAYFASPAYRRLVEADEKRDELSLAVINRLDNVVRAIGNLQKQVAGR
jgi:hypothetical protein